MRIFVSDDLPGDAVDRLRAVGTVDVGGGIGGTLFSKYSTEYNYLVTLLTDRIDGALLDRAPNVRLVANVAVGVDNIDLDACKARGVRVTNTPGVLTEATADLAFGLLLAAARRIAEADRTVRAGVFPPWRPATFLGAPVHGTVLGILGFGRIGQAVARRARGFGMKVLYAQRTRVSPDIERALVATWVSVDDLFTRSDFVSVHVPLTKETHHIVSRARISSMKPGSVLVNTSRGPCVDEAALAEALEGHLGAAGLDVFENEPVVHHDLLKRHNVVLTPHIASADRTAREAMARLAVDNVLAFLRGAPLPTPVV
jgi:glyoxylate reductase